MQTHIFKYINYTVNYYNVPVKFQDRLLVVGFTGRGFKCWTPCIYICFMIMYYIPIGMKRGFKQSCIKTSLITELGKLNNRWYIDGTCNYIILRQQIGWLLRWKPKLVFIFKLNKEYILYLNWIRETVIYAMRTFLLDHLQSRHFS